MTRSDEQPERSEDGVDLTLIRWMLSLTPKERLEVLQDQVDSLIYLRAKFESAVSRLSTAIDGRPINSSSGRRRFDG